MPFKAANLLLHRYSFLFRSGARTPSFLSFFFFFFWSCGCLNIRKGGGEWKTGTTSIHYTVLLQAYWHSQIYISFLSLKNSSSDIEVFTEYEEKFLETCRRWYFLPEFLPTERRLREVDAVPSVPWKKKDENDGAIGHDAVWGMNPH